MERSPSMSTPSLDAAPRDPERARFGARLTKYARDLVKEALGGPKAVRPAGPLYEERRAAFVTWRWPDDMLQGCIGHLEARDPLAEVIRDTSVSAALKDPRGSELALSDVDTLHVEVSLLSPMTPIAFTDEASAMAALRPGKDGVVLTWRGRRATFLPQVWEHFSNPADFLSELKYKAGLRPDFWAPDVGLFRYEVEIFEDP